MICSFPGSIFLACRAVLQWPQNNPDVPFARIADAHLYWYNAESEDREVECVLHYAEWNLGEPITAGLYDIETTVRSY